MKYCLISNTDIKVSNIALGTASIGSNINERDSYALMDEYINLGGNFIDTALVYGNWSSSDKSVSEKTIGKWLKLNNLYDSVTVATKGAHPSGTEPDRLSFKDIISDLEQSREHLGLDTIPFYWLHRDDRNRPVDDILETLNYAVGERLINYFGCSNWRCDRIEKANKYASSHGLKGFAASQISWSAAYMTMDSVGDKTLVVMDDNEWNWYNKNHMTAVAYASQAGGIFSKIAAGNYMSNLDSVNTRRYLRIKELSEKSGRSVTDIVLAYIINNEVHGIPIVGCRTINQLRDSLHATDIILSSEEIKYIETV